MLIRFVLYGLGKLTPAIREALRGDRVSGRPGGRQWRQAAP